MPVTPACTFVKVSLEGCIGCYIWWLSNLAGLLQCCDLKDIKLAYQLNKALEKGDNWKFLDVDRSNGYW